MRAPSSTSVLVLAVSAAVLAGCGGSGESTDRSERSAAAPKIVRGCPDGIVDAATEAPTVGSRKPKVTESTVKEMVRTLSVEAEPPSIPTMCVLRYDFEGQKPSYRAFVTDPGGTIRDRLDRYLGRADLQPTSDGTDDPGELGYQVRDGSVGLTGSTRTAKDDDSLVTFDVWRFYRAPLLEIGVLQGL